MIESTQHETAARAEADCFRKLPTPPRRNGISREETKGHHPIEQRRLIQKSQAVMQLGHAAVECDVVLESMDECVGCLDGIGKQHHFEESLSDQAARQRQIAVEHGLSEAEATLIRLQMLDAGADGVRSAVQKTLTSVLCGQQDDSVPDFFDFVVNPMDTTLPTSLPGDALVESRQGKSARSLVDVAGETEGIGSNNEMKAKVDKSAQECAICNDSCTLNNGDPNTRSLTSLSTRMPTFCYLPCCHTEESNDNFKICTACMLVLTVVTNDGASRVGRCPRCRTWIAVNTLHSTSAVMDVRTMNTSGKCESCLRITTPLITENPAICDACFLGREVPLIYECEECHQSKTIHSTMYRSQHTPTSVGSEMWPCDTCEKSTHWTIRFEQLTLIPAGDIPEEWGHIALELARTRVKKARQGIAKLDLLGRNAQGMRTKDDRCVVM